MAVGVTEAVAAYTHRVRRFYYRVMLLGHGCPRCSGSLSMVAEGRCRCRACAFVFDPTIAFQRCSECGGVPELAIRRYRCSQCGEGVVSRFLFDGLVFDAAYFREKMAESRARKQKQRTRLRAQLVENRSPAIDTGPVDLGSVADLAEAINSLVAGIPINPEPYVRQGLDLTRYESHMQAHLEPVPIAFDEIPRDCKYDDPANLPGA